VGHELAVQLLEGHTHQLRAVNQSH
jgi:hypothetical protein